MNKEGKTLFILICFRASFNLIIIRKMKSLIFYLIFFAAVPATMQAQVNDGDAFYFGTYDKEIIRSHKIKEVKVSSFINAEFTSNAFYHFDKKGYLLKLLRQDTSGKLTNEIVFEYNNNGDQQSFTETIFITKNKYETIFYKSYEGNKLIFDSSGSLGIAKRFLYNDSGKIQTTITSMGNNFGKGKFDFHYNEAGLLSKIVETTILPDGSSNLFGTVNYLFDNTNKVIRRERVNGATYEFAYYDNGLLKTKLIAMPAEFNNMQLPEKYTYSYWD